MAKKQAGGGMTELAKRGQREPRKDTRIDFNANRLFNENPYDLDALPVIDGYVFKWFRSYVLGKEDGDNISKAKKLYWRPVLIEDLQTAAENQPDKIVDYLSTITFGSLSGVVGTHDMVLMMRPKEIDDAHKQHLRQIIDNQEQSVESTFQGSLPDGFNPMRKAMIDD